MIYISKSQFKPHALEYLRKVEEKNISLVITHYGKPVAKVIPHTHADIDESLLLRDSVIAYDDPTEPVAEDSWEVLA